VDINAALADCLQTFMETRDLAALETQYAAITTARASMSGAAYLKTEECCPA
jgi:hypothetical protein